MAGAGERRRRPEKRRRHQRAHTVGNPNGVAVVGSRRKRQAGRAKAKFCGTSTRGREWRTSTDLSAWSGYTRCGASAVNHLDAGFGAPRSKSCQWGITTAVVYRAIRGRAPSSMISGSGALFMGDPPWTHLATLHTQTIRTRLCCPGSRQQTADRSWERALSERLRARVCEAKPPPRDVRREQTGTPRN